MSDNKLKNKFPNGYTSWYTTFYFISVEIGLAMGSGGLVDKYENDYGIDLLPELAEKFTMEFETLTKDINWDDTDKDAHKELTNFILSKEL